MDETSDEDEDADTQASSSAGPRLMGQSAGSRLGASGMAPTGLGTSALGLATDPPPDESRDMSVSTLHLYDLHISQVSSRFNPAALQKDIGGTNDDEDTGPRVMTVSWQ